MTTVRSFQPKKIQNLIYAIRGMQVMLDSDLASLYGVETKALNQAVKRNRERFPGRFMFKLTVEEEAALRSQFVTFDNPEVSANLRSQSVTSRSGHGGRRTMPYAFTEQGVAMLSSVLRSKAAVSVSIRIMDAFVHMRRFLLENGHILSRIGSIEQKQIETDQKIDRIFTALEERDITPKKGVFFDGQVYDAYVLVAKIIRSAKKSLILIDNYIDDSVLTLLIKRRDGVSATIYTRSLTKQLQLDIQRHNQQYPPVVAKEIKGVHDRFLIVDGQTVYHIGASLKDLGKKWFAFSRMGKEGLKIVEKLST